MVVDLNKPSTVGAVSFRTRARTVDHLGREQIADCPTAVSELWKNAWDAYARNVLLRVFDEEPPVAVLTDDGHGMRESDFFDKWFVIGTESKVAEVGVTPSGDRNGLSVRSKQGQKGIGRLSSAKLGSVLLLITKYQANDYLAALIDWRMFENPYINLSDVAVATGQFAQLNDVFGRLEGMANTLALSVVSNVDNWRELDPKRQEGWELYDKEWELDYPDYLSLPPSTRILQSLKRLPFRLDHLDGWTGPGTAMLIFEIDDDLKTLPDSGDTNEVESLSRQRFEQTLSSFIDPYSTERERPVFTYRAEIYQTAEGEGAGPQVVVGVERTVDRTQVQEMEHQLEGTVGSDGVFRGRVKAFGSWTEGVVTFDVPKGVRIPDRANSRVGEFEIFIASMEFQPGNSGHSSAEHTRYLDLAKDYSGLLIYRDGIRILPYGREDNDFFEIEYKRSKNAGRYFWNHRQMFGRIALSRQQNPNLKDKAGREGFIDNTAAKTFRAIIENILDESARRFFGSASDIRVPRIEEIKAENAAGKAKEQEKKLRARERHLFRNELDHAEAILPNTLKEIRQEVANLKLECDEDVVAAAARTAEWRTKLASAMVRQKPSGLERLTDRYEGVQHEIEDVSKAITDYETQFREIVKDYASACPTEIVLNQIRDAKAAVRKQIEDYRKRTTALQHEQFADIGKLATRRVDEFAVEAEALRTRHDAGALALEDVIDAVTELRDAWTTDNRELFGIYLSALETVKEEIDLETLAIVQVKDLRAANAELDRLTALAQLGIAVEITAHDLADFDEMISAGLKALPDSVRDNPAVRDIRLGVEGLTDQLRFLSPLRLSGDKVQRWIGGAEIEEFVRQFFASTLARAGIELSASDAFRSMRIFERPARVFPVFLNLVNNSVYWVGTVPRSNRHILFDILENEVVIADSGPGVQIDDIDHIFKLFFTRKQRSGRGVGLYLARTNLAAGAHTIRYRTNEDNVLLDGAAFMIGFRGIEIDGQEEE